MQVGLGQSHPSTVDGSGHRSTIATVVA
jgi:hypothetical protein